jgi:hypothetical protein
MMVLANTTVALVGEHGKLNVPGKLSQKKKKRRA